MNGKPKLKNSVIRDAIEKIVLENARILDPKENNGHVLEFALTNELLAQIEGYVE